MTKVRYFFMLHFQSLGPWEAHRVKIQVDQDLWQVSRSCSISLKSSNHKFESSKNIVLSSLRPLMKSTNDMNKSKVYTKKFFVEDSPHFYGSCWYLYNKRAISKFGKLNPELHIAIWQQKWLSGKKKMRLLGELKLKNAVLDSINTKKLFLDLGKLTF